MRSYFQTYMPEHYESGYIDWSWDEQSRQFTYKIEADHIEKAYLGLLKRNSVIHILDQEGVLKISPTYELDELGIYILRKDGVQHLITMPHA